MDTDSPLITALADDLDGSFEALVLAHQDRLYSIALRVLGDPSDAEKEWIAKLARQRSSYRRVGLDDGRSSHRVRRATLNGSNWPSGDIAQH